MARHFYRHYSLVDTDKFKKRWPNFSPAEIASKGEGEVAFFDEDLDKLQALRTMVGKPMVLTSAYRSEAHNKRVGGAADSMHRCPDRNGWRGSAFDVRMENHDPIAFEEAAKRCGFAGIGHYPKKGFMHIDTGPARRWNKGGWFKRTAIKGFSDTIEPKVNETVVDTLKKPEILSTGIALAPSVVGAAQGNGPVQWAFAAIALLAFLVGMVLFIHARVKAANND